jgi:hypothetical protein
LFLLLFLSWVFGICRGVAPSRTPGGLAVTLVIAVLLPRVGDVFVRSGFGHDARSYRRFLVTA